jgi:dipeptidyl aminopeptidase/acylaminoacyl peptidase
MKVVKAIFTVVVLLVLALAGFSFIPPGQYQPPRRDQSDETPFNFTEKVGSYRMHDGRDWLITFDAGTGLILARFEPFARMYLKPHSEDIFTWEKDGANHELEFHRDSTGGISGATWLDEDGERITITPTESYRQSEARFTNRDVELAGTLMTPPTPGPHPAAVFIHGSGVSDRDNLWYLHQADYLARHGVVVLFPDKRGCGKSRGEWHVASFADFAEDALAGVRFLKEIEAVDPARIGLVGFSQGGWIAPLAASQSADVSFVVNVAGSATTPNEQLRHEVAADMRNMGVVRPLAASMAPLYARRAKKRRPVWWQKNGDFDPIDYWRRLSIPVLVFYGSKDEDDNVPVSESVARLEAVKARNPSANLTIRVYEDSGHAMEAPGAATKFARPDYLEMLTSWIHQVPGGSY